MRRTIVRFLSLTSALILCIAMTIPAMAESEPSTAGDATSVQVDVNLILDAQTVPSGDITITLAGDKTEFESSGYKVADGVTTDVKVDVDGDALDTTGIVVSFAADDRAMSGPIPNTEIASGRYYAQKTVTIDFSDVTFLEPGAYVYTLQETGSTVAGMNLDMKTLYMIVYVEYPVTNGVTAQDLTIRGVAVTTSSADANAGIGGSSVTGKLDYAKGEVAFNNEAASYDLKVEKKVSGNQGNRKKAFTFSGTISGAIPGTYTITYSPATAGNTSGNVKTVTVSADGSATLRVVLKHGESFTIENLNAGAKWNVTENADGYKPDTVVSGDPAASAVAGKNGAENTTGISADTTVTVTNTLNGTIPTGVLLTIAPFVGLMVVGAAGVLLVLKKKKN